MLRASSSERSSSQAETFHTLRCTHIWQVILNLHTRGLPQRGIAPGGGGSGGRDGDGAGGADCHREACKAGVVAVGGGAGAGQHHSHRAAGAAAGLKGAQEREAQWSSVSYGG